jgi:hypothetical protein
MKCRIGWQVILLGAILTPISGFSEGLAADSSIWGLVNGILAKPIDKKRLEDLSGSGLEKTEDNT